MAIRIASQLFLGCACLAIFQFPTPMLAQGPKLGNATPLTVEEEKRIDQTIGRGVAFLRRAQLPTGTWIVPKASQYKTTGPAPSGWAVGYAALPALALLEAGIPAADPGIQRAASFVRANIANQPRTYEISLAILFLHRLGEEKDHALIRSLALRLAGGQRALGGWGYHCPVLSATQEKKLLEILTDRKVPEDSETTTELAMQSGKPLANERWVDNSNTQFAILALWTARNYDLPLNSVFAAIEKRFRLSQTKAGWDYSYHRTSHGGGAMTCVGLLGIAAGRGSVEKAAKGPREDLGIAWGLRALAICMNDATDRIFAEGMPAYGPKGALNLYFLWSVERVGVVLNLKTIGGVDWYRWGAQPLLHTQRHDGSWIGRGNGGSPVIDTSMALLFLKRSDLLPDLRETLQKRLKITDPGLDKSMSPKKSPGEKSDPKSGTKSLGEKEDGGQEKSELKNSIPKKKESGEKTGPDNQASRQLFSQPFWHEDRLFEDRLCGRRIGSWKTPAGVIDNGQLAANSVLSS